jgi:low affinity Fe/Cu permease
MENQVLMFFVVATALVFLASTTLLFGVLWRRERAMRRRTQDRLRAQEASFAAALGQTQQVIKESRAGVARLAALEREVARMRPVFAEMEQLVRINS